MANPSTTLRCLYDSAYTLQAQAADTLPETRVIVENSVGNCVAIYLNPDDAAALGAQLIDIAFKQGALSAEVLRDYANALYDDAHARHLTELAADLYNDGNGVG